MDGTYEITDLNVTGAGKILKMKVNGKVVDVVTDIKRNVNKEITAISINGVAQDIAGGGGEEAIPTEWHIWKTGADSYVLLPFDDATNVTDLETFKALKVAVMNDAAQIEIIDLADYAGFDDLSSFTADSAGQFTVENDGVEAVYKIGSAYTQIVDLDTDINRTIDVSQYAGPVNLTPAEGKNAMIGARVTLTNIPAGGSAAAYAWKVGNDYNYLNINTAPSDPAGANGIKQISSDTNNVLFVESVIIDGVTYTYVSDTEFTISFNGGTVTFTRDSTKDFTLW